MRSSACARAVLSSRRRAAISSRSTHSVPIENRTGAGPRFAVRTSGGDGKRGVWRARTPHGTAISRPRVAACDLFSAVINSDRISASNSVRDLGSTRTLHTARTARIALCLGAFHQKFTTVHSPNTEPGSIGGFANNLDRHGGCSPASRHLGSWPTFIERHGTIRPRNWIQAFAYHRCTQAYPSGGFLPTLPRRSSPAPPPDAVRPWPHQPGRHHRNAPSRWRRPVRPSRPTARRQRSP